MPSVLSMTAQSRGQLCQRSQPARDVQHCRALWAIAWCGIREGPSHGLRLSSYRRGQLVETRPQARGIMACDFFTMETVQLKTLYGEPVAGLIHEYRGSAA